MYICKRCDYEREDEPKESWETCPNCDSFDWMVKGERNDKKWTTEPPIQEGWYWAYFPRDYTKKTECLLIKFDHNGKPFDADNIEYGVGCNLEAVSHWLGPIPQPQPPEDK